MGLEGKQNVSKAAFAWAGWDSKAEVSVCLEFGSISKTASELSCTVSPSAVREESV